MTPGKKIARQLTVALEKFAESHPGTIDEFVMVLEDHILNDIAIVPHWVVPARSESEGYRYAEDAVRLVNALRKNKKKIRKGVIVSVPDAPGTEFDAAVFLSKKYVLLINSKGNTFDELSSQPDWPTVEEELRTLTGRLDAIIREM